MRVCKRVLIQVGIVLVLASAPAAVRAGPVFDAANDFSLASNPNGVWSYGFENTLGGSLQLFDVATMNARGATGLDAWTSSHTGDTPTVMHNGTNAPLTFGGTVTVPADGLLFHPGPNGQFAIIRWTAPSAGNYDLDVSFRGDDFVGPTTTDVHVLDNGVSLFASGVTAYGPGPSFSSVVSVAAGDKIDFAVGVGTDGSYLFDSTGIEAIISPAISGVPGPASLTLFALGGLGLLGLTRGRRKRELA